MVSVAARPRGGAPAPRAGLLFDLDGTLAQSEPLHFAAFQAIVAEAGRDLGHDDFVRHVSGRSNAAIMAFLFPDADAAVHRDLAERKEASFRALAASGGLDPTPGAIEVLAWARRRQVATGLVTNAPRANAELMVSVLGLADAFDAILTADEVARGKPHPDPYLTAMRLLALAPAATVVVEDSLPGIAAARAAGLRVVALATPATASVVRGSGADLVVTSLADASFYAFLERSFAVQPGAS